MMLMASDIVMVISGPEFTGAVLPMIIISPLVLIVGYEQILVLQTLLPLGKDTVMLRNSIIGAVIGVALNVLLVPSLASIGSALVWIAVECVILVLSQIAVTKEISLRFPLDRLLVNLLVYLPLAGLMIACTFIPAAPVVKMGASMTVAALYICVYQLVIKKGQLLKQLK